MIIPTLFVQWFPDLWRTGSAPVDLPPPVSAPMSPVVSTGRGWGKGAAVGGRRGWLWSKSVVCCTGRFWRVARSPVGQSAGDHVHRSSLSPLRLLLLSSSSSRLFRDSFGCCGHKLRLGLLLGWGQLDLPRYPDRLLTASRWASRRVCDCLHFFLQSI
jgi:hypothetical protein